MIEFLNLALVGGLLAAAAPVIIHLLHRRRVKPVTWGAMQFLLEALAKHRRRLQLDELLLLLVRLLAVSTLATALLRPATRSRSGREAGRVVRQGQVAAVLLVDDSLSTGSGRAQTALADVQQLAQAYLSTLVPGDEVSILLTSQLSRPRPEPLFDLEGAKAMIARLKSTAAASDMPGMLEAGLAQFQKHVNPAAELVLVFDGRADGWRTNETARWEELRGRLRGPPDATPGSRQRPRLLVLCPDAAPPESNLAVSDLRMDRTFLTTNRLAGIRVEVSHFGRSSPSNTTLHVRVDGRAAAQQSFAVRAGEQVSLSVPYTFRESGSHWIEVQLECEADSLPLDNQRALSVEVEDAVPVLLVEGVPDTGLGGELGFVAAALDPQGTGGSGFRCRRVSAAQLDEALIVAHRVIVLGDTPGLPGETLNALERRVVSGGGVLVTVGGLTKPELLNRYWYRLGTGLLPAGLAKLEAPPQPIRIAGMNRGHPVFHEFPSMPMDLWREAGVRQFYRLDTTAVKASELNRLLWLESGDPLLVESRRGAGLVVECATSLSRQWNDLALLAAYVPLVQNLVGHLGSYVYPPRNLQPGERLIFVGGSADSQAVARNAAGQTVGLTPSAWEGRPAWISEPLVEPGGYTVQQAGHAYYYAVAPEPAESEMKPLSEEALRSVMKDTAYARLASEDQVRRSLPAGARDRVELWPWLVLACLGFLFVETALTRRETLQTADRARGSAA